MLSRFVVHQHRAGRLHFDLRIIVGDILRSWSMLKQPSLRSGEKRLAIERESYPADLITGSVFEEEAFGRGQVLVWDRGEVEVCILSARCLALTFKGSKISGYYELRQMLWYPGNRWLLTKKA